MVTHDQLPVLIIYGPTAVGKTAFVEGLIDQSLQSPACPSFEVINGDMGQLYSALSIGTAKPDLKNQKVPHHMFDVVGEPVDFSAYEYRNRCARLLSDSMARGNIPVIVGGSGFYIRSLFFPPPAVESTVESEKGDRGDEGDKSEHEEGTWQDLYAIDPERARVLHPHDAYRINRALALWRKTGIIPSTLKPQFDPVAYSKVIYLDRERDDLAGRINLRVKEMFELGWLDEVASLPPHWCPFLKRKGLMGYGDLCQALESGSCNQEELISVIQSKTRTYARRQRIFWRGLRPSLAEHGVGFSEFNLTFSTLDLYIKQVLNSLFS